MSLRGSRGGHAVGVYSTGNGYVYYFDPNIGVFRMSSHDARHALPVFMSSHYHRSYSEFYAIDVFVSETEVTSLAPSRSSGNRWYGGRR